MTALTAMFSRFSNVDLNKPGHKSIEKLLSIPFTLVGFVTLLSSGPPFDITEVGPLYHTHPAEQFSVRVAAASPKSARQSYSSLSLSHLNATARRREARGQKGGSSVTGARRHTFRQLSRAARARHERPSPGAGLAPWVRGTGFAGVGVCGEFAEELAAM